MLATYQDPKAIYGSVAYATPQMVQPQVIQQPQVYQTPGYMAAPQPQMQRPVPMSQMPGPSMASSEFPYTAMQVTGGLQIAMGLLLLGLGIAAVVIDPMSTWGALGSFGIDSIVLSAILSIITGVIGLYHRQGSGNLEAFRNTYMVMGSVLAVYCMVVVGIEIYLLIVVNAAVVFGGGAPAGFEIYNGIYIALVAITALEGLMALIGASIGCCCAPKCCSPLVTQGEYSFMYTKQMNNFVPMGYPARPMSVY